MPDLLRLRAGLAAAAPSVALLLAILLLAVPLRLFQGFVPTPILSLLIVFLYGLYDPDALPPYVTFAAGLVLDLLTGTALGPWASVHLLVFYLVVSQRTYFLGRARDVVWIGCGVALIAAMLVLWLERAILSGGFPPLLPALYQFAITVALYPVAAYVFFWLRARQGVREEWQV